MAGAQGLGLPDGANRRVVPPASVASPVAGALVLAGAMIFIELPLAAVVAVVIVGLYFVSVRTVSGRGAGTLRLMPLVFGISFWVWLLSGVWDSESSSSSSFLGTAAAVVLFASGAIVIFGGLLAPVFLLLARLRRR